jgi:DNA sulfur modification protein DndB
LLTLNNITSLASLGPLARRLRDPYLYQSVDPKRLPEYLETGWAKVGNSASTVRVRKLKPTSEFFEHRVWKLLYDLQFPFLSGKNGATITNTDDGGAAEGNVSIATFDNDVALCVNCAAAKPDDKLVHFEQEAKALSAMRGTIARALPPTVGGNKRKIATILWTQGITLNDEQKVRARAEQIKLFDEAELDYYEQLVAQLGVAAKYQLLADIFANLEIPGLNVVVPAIRTKLGKATTYTFPIRPANLLRIAYVSHRSKGKATDVDTYQRLIKRNRLKSIQKYIDGGGYFPTNIVINIPGNVEFHKAENPRGYSASTGDFGWLRLPPKYKSAWIIDGQHRLFAYAGSAMADKSELIVLAFAGLAPSEQAKLFVDINGEQKSVKQNLLVELWAELFWDSPDLTARTKAVISKTIMALDTERDSALFGRINKADDKSTDIRCLSLQTLTAALNKPEFFVSASRNVITPGAFWAQDNESTRRRATLILKSWFA